MIADSDEVLEAWARQGAGARRLEATLLSHRGRQPPSLRKNLVRNHNDDAQLATTDWSTLSAEPPQSPGNTRRGGRRNGRWVLASCGGNAVKSRSDATAAGSQGETVKRGGTLTTFRQGSPAEGFEPFGARSQSADAQPLFAQVYSTLLRLKLGQPYKYADRTLEGELASQWEQPDPQTLTIRLKPGVKFQNKPPVNGRTLTSADVKFSYERLLESPFSYVNLFNSITAVETPDPQIVVLKTKAPDATLLPHLAMGFAWITAKEAGKPDPKSAAALSFKDRGHGDWHGPIHSGKISGRTGANLCSQS